MDSKYDRMRGDWPLGRPPVLDDCKKYNLNIKTADYKWLQNIGDGNASLGLRRYLEVKDKFEKRNYER